MESANIANRGRAANPPAILQSKPHERPLKLVLDGLSCLTLGLTA
jgi:hypothetical protein